ncbi:MAG TPA: hypothetical protein VIQ74_11185 [Gemmatimonadaceae bacterium]|jgi:hypothetical protein
MPTRLLPLLLVVVMTTQGCYSYVPFNGATTTPGASISLELNDPGRVAVGERLGPELDRLDGVLTFASDSDIVLGVSEVRDIRGGVTTWSGETVHVRPAYTKQIFERRLDKRKTSFFAASAVALVGAFIITRNLAGWGDDSPGTKVPGDGSDTQ